MLQTPVLLIIFNRPDTTRKVFNAIRQVKPNQLYVVADGPRMNVAEDEARCKATREEIKVDWVCELHTLYRNENRGCGYGPAEGITWFFEHEEQGIILEDDCLPGLDFFPFCEELLNRYRTEERIGMISGFNKMPGWKNKKSSYIFTYLGDTWGWATWKRAWDLFDYDIKSWKDPLVRKIVAETLNNQRFFNLLSSDFDKLCDSGQNHIWDYQWLFSRLSHKLCSVSPGVNLIENIGIGSNATHTFSEHSFIVLLKIENFKFPIIHHDLYIDRFYEKLLYERYSNPNKRSLIKKVFLKFLKIITNTN